MSVPSQNLELAVHQAVDTTQKLSVGIMVTYILTTNQEVSGSIPDSAMGIALVGNYSTDCVLVAFAHILSCVVFGGGNCTLLITASPDASMFLYLVHRNFQNPETAVSCRKGT